MQTITGVRVLTRQGLPWNPVRRPCRDASYRLPLSQYSDTILRWKQWGRRLEFLVRKHENFLVLMRAAGCGLQGTTGRRLLLSCPPTGECSCTCPL